MKNILIPLLTVLLLAVDLTGADFNGFTYEVENNEATITGYTGSESDLVVPSNIGGMAVTGIGANAFQSKGRIVSIVIPDSVVRIGAYAFYDCWDLEKVTLPNQLREIEDYTFCYANQLDEIHLPEALEEIGYRAFCGCSNLDSIVFYEGLKYIRRDAFLNCGALTELFFPASIKTLETYAFALCDSLETATFYGDAPETQGYIFHLSSATFHIYFHTGTLGFTSPEWDHFPSFEIAGADTISGRITDISGQNVPGVSISFSGLDRKVTSSSAGYWAFDEFNGNYQTMVVPSKTGYVFEPSYVIVGPKTDLSSVNFIASELEHPLPKVWTEVSTPTTETLNDVVYTGGEYVAVGDGGIILTSSNGIQWSRVASSFPDRFNSIAASEDGTIRVVAADSGYVLVSEDRGPWQKVTFENSDDFVDVAYSEYHKRFVLSDEVDHLYYSDDGIHWVAVESEEIGGIVGLVALNDKFYALGGRGHLAISDDGVLWSRSYSSSLNSSVSMVAIDDMVATFQYGSEKARLTKDGNLWFEWDYGTLGSSVFDSVRYGGDKGVDILSGSAGWIISIPNDDLWQEHDVYAIEDLNGIACHGHQVLAVGFRGTIVVGGEKNQTLSGSVRLESDTGLNGVTVNFSDGAGKTVTELDGGFNHSVPDGWTGMVVPAKSGYTFDPSYIIVEDTDNLSGPISFVGKPLSWNVPSRWDIDSSLNNANNLTDVAYCNNQFVAVGSPSFIASSSDGVDWSPVESPASVGLTAIKHFNYGERSKTVMVGTNGWIFSTEIEDISSSKVGDWTAQLIAPGTLLTELVVGGTTAPLMVATNTKGSIYTAGVDDVWTLSYDIPSDSVSGMVYAENTVHKFYVVTYDGDVFAPMQISDTGLSQWTKVYEHLTDNVNGVVVIDDFVAVFSYNSDTAFLSKDGIHWYEWDYQVSASTIHDSVRMGGEDGIDFLCGSAGWVISIPDADLWDDQNIPLLNELMGIDTDGYNVVAVGTDGKVVRGHKTYDLSGQVYGDGVPVPFVPIAIYNSVSGELVEQITSREDGQFFFLDLPKGEYRLEISNAGSFLGRTKYLSLEKSEIIEIQMVEKITLLNPSDSGNVYGTTPCLDWQPVDDCDHYSIEIIQRDTGLVLDLNENFPEDYYCLSSSNALSPDEVYTLNLIAYNVEGEMLAKSNDSWFRVLEALDPDVSLNHAYLSFDGNAEWFFQEEVSQDGNGSLQSGEIWHNQKSILRFTALNPGVLTYEWKCSSEFSYDYLELWINGVFSDSISGEIDWVPRVIEIDHANTLIEWRYRKDISISTGADAGWVDNIQYNENPLITVDDTVIHIGSEATSVVVGVNALQQWNPSTNNSWIDIPSGSFSGNPYQLGIGVSEWKGKEDRVGKVILKSLHFPSSETLKIIQKGAGFFTTGIQKLQGKNALQFTSDVGKIYQLWESSNMVDWHAVGAPVVAIGEQEKVVLPENCSGKFYKITVESLSE